MGSDKQGSKLKRFAVGVRRKMGREVQLVLTPMSYRHANETEARYFALMLKLPPTSPQSSLLFFSTTFGIAAFLFVACSAGFQSREEATATVRDLDSLHRVAQYEDSVNANLFFYEEAFGTYQKTYPSVTKSEYMRIARGKDQAFCLFQPQPGNHCLHVGEQFIKVGLKEPAHDAFEAGLLSQKFNGDALNIKLWTSLAQMHYDAKEFGIGRSYLEKILSIDPKHQWAKKQLASTRP